MHKKEYKCDIIYEINTNSHLHEKLVSFNDITLRLATN